MKKVYFAHPVNIYGQPLEQALESLIANALTEGDRERIENPNQPKHQVGYDNYARRARESQTGHKGMNYFYDEVLPGCDGCVAVPFLDNKFGLGVAGEMQWFLRNNKPVWCFWNTLGIFELSPDPVLPYFERFILANDPRFVVPHEETRLRTWRVYNKERRPYEEAHLVSMPIPEGFYPNG